jgi:hypothetical protein
MGANMDANASSSCLTCDNLTWADTWLPWVRVASVFVASGDREKVRDTVVECPGMIDELASTKAQLTLMLSIVDDALSMTRPVS